MYPEGHARRPNNNLDTLLAAKFERLAALAVDDVEQLRNRFTNLRLKSAPEIAQLHDIKIAGQARSK
jgi:hypothetical protein